MVELVKVTADKKDVLNNLMEKYLYEFSQWEKRTSARMVYTATNTLTVISRKKTVFPILLWLTESLQDSYLLMIIPRLRAERQTFAFPNFLYYINIAEMVSDVRRFVRFWTDITENGS